jgi:ribonuclease HI
MVSSKFKLQRANDKKFERLVIETDSKMVARCIKGAANYS